jgi:hypothetical protein
MFIQKGLTDREVNLLYNHGKGWNNVTYADFGVGSGSTLKEATLNSIKTGKVIGATSYQTATGTVSLIDPGGVWASALTESVAERTKLSNRLKGLIVKLSLSSSAGKRTRFQLIKLYYRIFEKSL